MAPLELAPLAERPSGIAFEVLVKSAAGAAAVTPGRLRLESYGAGAAALPRLLRSRAERAAEAHHEAVKAAPCAAEKPPQIAAKSVSEAPKAERWERFIRRMQARFDGRPKPPATAAGRGSPCSAGARQLRARAHNEEVLRKVAAQKSAATARLERLREQAMRPAPPTAPSIRNRCEKAGLHNAKVTRNVQERKSEIAEKAAALNAKVMREKLERPDTRMEKASRHNTAVLRKREQHRRTVESKAEALRSAQRLMAKEGQVSVTRRCEKATQHNRQVAGRLAERRGAGAKAVANPRTSAARIDGRLEKARRHNEAVALAAETRKQRLAQEAKQTRQRLQRKADARSRNAAGTASRRTRARMHNDAVKRKVAGARVAHDRWTKRVVEKLEKKTMAAALIRARRGTVKRVARGAPAAGDAAGTPGDSPHRFRFPAVLIWLVALLPCS